MNYMVRLPLNGFGFGGDQGVTVLKRCTTQHVFLQSVLINGNKLL